MEIKEGKGREETKGRQYERRGTGWLTAVLASLRCAVLYVYEQYIGRRQIWVFPPCTRTSCRNVYPSINPRLEVSRSTCVYFCHTIKCNIGTNYIH